jgi:hypothetical protein
VPKAPDGEDDLGAHDARVKALRASLQEELWRAHVAGLDCGDVAHEATG